MESLPEIGDVVDGTYKLVGLLGKGGFGAVYRARQINMDRDVALKLLIASGPKFTEMVKRFRREVMAIRNLTHPNTVRIYDFHDDPEGHLYYTMEALNGVTLKQEVRSQGPLSPRRMRHVLIQVLKSLSEAHSLKIVHRDLKPSNIMLVDMHGETDFVKVLDFGIAKLLQDGGDQDHLEELTSAGVLVGTLKYMAPEQISGGSEKLGPFTDLYALGLIAVEMLSGESIYSGSGRWEVLRQQVSDEPVTIPEPVRASSIGPILEKCLEKDQSLRFSTAQQVIDALNSVDSRRIEDQPLYVSDGDGGWVPRAGGVPRSHSGAYDTGQVEDFEDLDTVVVDGALGDDDPTEVTPRPVHHDDPSASAHRRDSQPGAAAPVSAGAGSQLEPVLESGAHTGVDADSHRPETGETAGDSDLYPKLQANRLRRSTVVSQTDDEESKKWVPLAVGLVLFLSLGGVGTWVYLDAENGESQTAVADEEIAEPEADHSVDEELAAGQEELGDEVEEDIEDHIVNVTVEDEDVRAEIYIDDEFQGRTPYSLKLSEGESALLRLEADNHEPLETEIDGQTPAEFGVELQPIEEADDDEAGVVAGRGQSDSDSSAPSGTGSGDRGQREEASASEAEEAEEEAEREEDSDSASDWVDIQRSEERETEERREREVPIFD